MYADDCEPGCSYRRNITAMVKSPDRLYNQLDRLEALIKGPKLEEFVMKAADGKRELMADLNREQLADGIRADGSRITPEYAESTVAKKKKEGKPSDRVTLFDTGAWSSEIKARRLGKTMFLQSVEAKNEKLKKTYGLGIQGLTEENLAVVSKALLPSLIDQTENFLDG